MWRGRPATSKDAPSFEAAPGKTPQLDVLIFHLQGGTPGRLVVRQQFFRSLDAVLTSRENRIADLVRLYTDKLNAELNAVLSRINVPRGGRDGFVPDRTAVNLRLWRVQYGNPNHSEVDEDKNIIYYQTAANRLAQLQNFTAETRNQVGTDDEKDQWLDRLHGELTEMQRSFVGMESVKESVANKVASFILDPTVFTEPHHWSFMLQGAPGTGKSAIALFLMRIYYRIGLLIQEPATALVAMDKSAFVASYQGQTSYRTRNVIASHLGGAIFLDEAYTLIAGKDDQYGHDALDQIVLSLTEFIGLIIFIMAGYKEKIEAQLFKSNPGLERRFGDIYVLPNYGADFLYSLLVRKTRPLVLTPDALQLMEIIHAQGGFSKTNAAAIDAILVFARGNATKRAILDPDVPFQPRALSARDIVIGIQRYAYQNEIYLVRH